jgi:hypothetical protein
MSAGHGCAMQSKPLDVVMIGSPAMLSMLSRQRCLT